MTGLLDYNARYYDATLRRFISADTVIPDYANPQDLNRYGYVRGNPVRFTDPSGHCIPGVDCLATDDEGDTLPFTSPPVPTPTYTPTPSPTPTATWTPTQSQIPTPMPSPTWTPSPAEILIDGKFNPWYGYMFPKVNNNEVNRLMDIFDIKLNETF